MSLNRATVIGYLGQDPQLRYTPQGTPVCTLSVATDESYTNKQTGERKEAVEWHRIVVWGKLGELCGEYLAKGRQCFVEGRLQTREWTDKENKKNYTTEVVASNVVFLGGPRGEAGAGNGRARARNGDEYAGAPAPEEMAHSANGAGAGAEDDIPF